MKIKMVEDVEEGDVLFREGVIYDLPTPFASKLLNEKKAKRVFENELETPEQPDVVVDNA
jgi:hypothetical protein